MNVYLVERMVDVDTPLPAKLRSVVAKHYPDATIIGGAGYYASNADFQQRYAEQVARADAVITSRRTLGLGGTKECEVAMEAGTPVYTLHGQQLQEITHLWYIDPACLVACLHSEHRARMHPDPNRVAETRAAPKPAYADR